MVKRIIISGGAYDGSDRTGDFNSYLVSLAKERTASPKVTILPTAKFDNYDCKGEINAFIERGCTADAMFLSKYEAGDVHIRDTLLSSDIIYITSGSLPRITSEFKRTNADELIRSAYENGAVLFGSSAGAMCFCKSGYDDCGPNGSLEFAEGMGIIPYNFCPHFDSDTWKIYEDTCKELDISGIAADNGCAVTYFDGSFGLYKERPSANAYLFDKNCGHAKTVINEDGTPLNQK